MPSAFLNTYPRNLELIKQVNRYFYFRRVSVRIFYALVAALVLICAILAVVLTKVFWVACGILPVLFLLNYLRYKKAVHDAVNRELEACSLGTTVTVTISDGIIKHSCVGGKPRTLQVDDIVEVVDTKDFLLIFGPEGEIYPLHKEGFTEGNCEHFCYYLMENEIDFV